VNRRGGLGRGLAALIPPGELGLGVRATLAEVPVDAVQPNPRQPREVFDEEELEGLAASIRDIGVLQPIVVRPLGEDTFELIAGERRLRASKRAGLDTLPAVVRETEDSALLKEALVENIHRVQLNPLEEAAAYQQLLDDFGFTQEELARALGKSRPAISNTLRLLHLPEEVQRRVAAGVLTAGHAKALLGLGDSETMDRFATRTVTEGLSVRALEELIRLTLLEPADRDLSRPRRSSMSAPGLAELQDDLSDALASRVRIQLGARKGKLQIEFRSVDDLERLVGIIARGLDTDGAEAVTAEVPDDTDEVWAAASSRVRDDIDDVALEGDLALEDDLALDGVLPDVELGTSGPEGPPAPAPDAVAPVGEEWPAADPADALHGVGDDRDPITPDPLELDPTGRLDDESRQRDVAAIATPAFGADAVDVGPTDADATDAAAAAAAEQLDEDELDEEELERLTRPD
jgi:ParB family transcriptional regulator, chromosome partitioning protein